MTKRIAIILFNLGGPDNKEAIRPFLFNLFNDRAILRFSAIFRTPLAWLIAKGREKKAISIYAQIGNASPILKNTQDQARALEQALSDLGPVKCFIAMRYWNPQSYETSQEVLDFKPDEIILLPLYPQFSTSTTQSSFDDWYKIARKENLRTPAKAICCFPTDHGFVNAAVQLIKEQWDIAKHYGTPRLLFSAHGLPEKFIEMGDPYQWQCEQTAQAIVERLGVDNIDFKLCYQSRVGRLVWIGPATDNEIRRAGNEKRPIVLFPIAFVSEHSETLVELDLDYRKLAEESDVPYYARVATVATHPDFISGLADLVRKRLLLNNAPNPCSESGVRLCPSSFSGCPHAL